MQNINKKLWLFVIWMVPVAFAVTAVYELFNGYTFELLPLLIIISLWVMIGFIVEIGFMIESALKKRIF